MEYPSFKSELFDIIDHLINVLSQAKTLPGARTEEFERWERNCARIREEMDAEILRVAVVGPIKSGKSTFVNALFGGDYLRRGAGVVTSIVTRIRQGDELRARLFFKSVETINQEIAEALVLFPSSDWRSETGPFDIRNDQDRAELAQALNGLSSERLIRQDSRTAHGVLLDAYLKGYERVREVLEKGHKRLEYTGEDFAGHRDFTGDDSLSVYLRDVELRLDSGELGEHTEIADCQGSDSPNPLHLAMIQDYLVRTHLIVYVISGRTGLRQADIRFLNMIGKMGILENILFVLNFDFSEQESPTELKSLVRRTKEELSLIVADPPVFTLSALYKLFEAVGEKALSAKDQARFKQWRQEDGFVRIATEQREKFGQRLKAQLNQGRQALLLKNHGRHLQMTAQGLVHRLALQGEMMEKTGTEMAAILQKAAAHQSGIEGSRQTLRSALEGTVNAARKEIGREVDRFFDLKYGELMSRLLKFVRTYQPQYDNYADDAGARFTDQLYLLFQEFRQGLDARMAEEINPGIIRFAREMEDKIRAHLQTVLRSYASLAQEQLEQYNQTLSELGFPPLGQAAEVLALPDTEAVRNAAGLSFPPAAAAFQYGRRIQAEAMMHLGARQVARFFQKLFRRSPSPEKERAYALKQGMKRLRQETEACLRSHFLDYRENLKHQYLFGLLSAMAGTLERQLLERLANQVADLASFARRIRQAEGDQADAAARIQALRQQARELCTRLEKLNQAMPGDL